MARLCLIFLAVLVVVPEPAWSQTAKPQRDRVRPIDARSLDRYASLDDYLRARTPADLRAAMMSGPSRPADLRPINMSRSLGARGSGFDLPSIARAGNGTAAWLRGAIGRIDAAAAKSGSPDHLAAALDPLLRRLGPVLGLRDAATELTLTRVETDDLGYTHIRYDQQADGLPVWGAELVVHVDAKGEVYALNGRYEPSPDVSAPGQQLDADAAHALVSQRFRAEGRWSRDKAAIQTLLTREDHVRRVVHPLGDGSARIAWAVTMHPNPVERYTVLIDAEDGRELRRLQEHCTLVHDPDLGRRVQFSIPDTTPASIAAGTFLNASATDLNGANRSMRVHQADDGNFYMLWDLPNIGTVNAPDLQDVGGSMTLTANNTDLDNVGWVASGANSWADASSVSAHANTERVYQYFAGFGRRAINNRDESMITIVHVTDGGQPMDNAFWNGRVMAFGDGEEVFTPLAGALDVAAHEMAHGVIEHSANLEYQSQPGALNESFADVFGVLVDDDDFLLGEDITKAGFGTALRDLAQPDNPNVLSVQPAHMDQYQNLGPDEDNGGVHVNSGIPNRAAALVINAIGRPQTGQVYYRALTTYLTRTSQFGDARTALEQSAVDLFGDGSSQHMAVQSAFDAVGITSTTSGGGGSEGNEVTPVEGAEYIAFFVDSGQLALLDLTTDAVALVANAFTNGTTELSTPSGGSGVYFVDAGGYLSYLDMATLEVFSSDVFLFSEGDIWNVEVSPADDYVLMASAYANDPNLYAWSGDEVSMIELKPQTTQEGILDESIRYPDVISISPNPAFPAATFDALRAFETASDTLTFWSIFELDLGSQRVYDLIPAQPTDTSIGNITYSSTDPDLVAFNVFPPDGPVETVVADMATGDVLTLDVGGAEDADRPSFAPDDRALVVTSSSAFQLLIVDGEGVLSGFQFDEPLFHPRWFTFAGAAGTPVDQTASLPDRFRLTAAWPNPFNPSTNLSVAMPAASQASIVAFDLLGRRAATVFEGVLPAGSSTVRWLADGLPTGTYVVRLLAGGHASSIRVVLLR